MSKELERIKKVIKPKDIYEQVALDEDFEIIEKREKALEIIKEKQVDTYLLCSCNSVDEYNSMFEHRFGSYDERALTQKEYDLLKEVLL